MQGVTCSLVCHSRSKLCCRCAAIVLSLRSAEEARLDEAELEFVPTRLPDCIAMRLGKKEGGGGPGGVCTA